MPSIVEELVGTQAAQDHPASRLEPCPPSGGHTASQETRSCLQVAREDRKPRHPSAEASSCHPASKPMVIRFHGSMSGVGRINVWCWARIPTDESEVMVNSRDYLTSLLGLIGTASGSSSS